MTRRLDITRDVCPMTTVKVGMALAGLAPGAELEVLLREEALTKVVASLKTDGQRIASVGRREEFFLLLVEKSGQGTGTSAARNEPPAERNR
jgi:tRNA 2-thiouridine synthesizing protein A